MSENFPRGAAREESKKSNGKYRMGAIIFRGKNILSRGHNIDKTHPVWGSGFNQKIHAETHALYRAHRDGMDISGSSIFIYRENYLGEAIAKPCKHCYNKLKAAGVENIHYSGTIEEEKECIYKILYSY